MLLVPFTLFCLLLLWGTWSYGMRAWKRSTDPTITGSFRAGLRIRASFQFALSTLLGAVSLGSLGLSWLWLNDHAGHGWLYWGEVMVYILCHFLILLTWWILIRYERVGSPTDFIPSVVVRVMGTFLYPFLVDRSWPFTDVTVLLFLLLGGVLLWFQSRFFSVLSTSGSSPQAMPTRKDHTS